MWEYETNFGRATYRAHKLGQLSHRIARVASYIWECIILINTLKIGIRPKSCDKMSYLGRPNVWKCSLSIFSSFSLSCIGSCRLLGTFMGMAVPEARVAARRTRTAQTKGRRRWRWWWWQWNREPRSMVIFNVCLLYSSVLRCDQICECVCSVVVGSFFSITRSCSFWETNVQFIHWFIYCAKLSPPLLSTSCSFVLLEWRDWFTTKNVYAMSTLLLSLAFSVYSRVGSGKEDASPPISTCKPFLLMWLI